MIEFEQIIGRGTRTYEGKDFFTIWDFVKAHQTSTTPNGMTNRWHPKRPVARARRQLDLGRDGNPPAIKGLRQKNFLGKMTEDIPNEDKQIH